MRTTIFAFVFFATSAIAAVGTKSISLTGYTPETRFDVLSSGSGLNISVETLPLDFAKLQEVSSSPEWNGSEPMPTVRWIVLPSHGSADVHVRTLETSRSADDLLATQSAQADADKFASLGAPQVMRGIRMAPLAVKSVVKDENGNAIIARRIDIEIEFTGRQGQNEVDYTVPVSREFESLIRDMTLNPPARFPHRDLADPNSGKMLILRPSSLANQAALNSLNDFAAWKRRQGLDVTITSINTANQTPVMIRNVIREGYPEDPYDYVIIIGWYYSLQGYLNPDATLRFPAFAAPGDTTIRPSDLFYAALDNEGNETTDWLPDIMIGRMVAHSPALLGAVLNRSMRYELDPFTGPQGEEGDWYHRAIHCEDGVDTSSALTDADHEMALWVENNLTRNSLTTAVYKGNRLETQDDERASLEQGVCFASADGYLFGMADSIEGGWDLAQTGRMHPFVIANAHYYDIPRLYPFFSSGSVNAPNGPIGAVGFATSHWEAESRSLVGGAVRAFIHGADHTIANYWLGGVLGVMGDLAIISEDDENGIAYLKQKYSQVIMLGDPSVNLFTDLPKALDSNLPETLYPGATALAFRVTDADGEPVSGATVCINQTDRIHWVGKTDETGAVAISIPEGLAEGNAQITVSKQDYKPIYLPNMLVEYPVVNLVLQNFSIDPAPLVNGTSSALALTIENDGEQNGTELDVEFHSDSPFLTFSRNSAALVDIESGGNGGLASAVRLILSPSCPGGTVIQVMLNMSSRNDAWQAAFEVTTSGPRYEWPFIGAIYDNLRPGAEGTLSPRLDNNGDRDGIALSATLVSLTEHVRVVGANQNYPVIAPDSSAEPANPFRVAVDSLFVPGQTAEFELRLTGAGNVNTALRLRRIISTPDEGDPIGPDNYGYYAFDSGDASWPEAPDFRWFEINPDFEEGFDFRGTKLDLPDNAAPPEPAGISTLIDLPFTFRFYGQDFDHLVVCSNGWVSFDTLSIGYKSPNNEGIPGTGAAPDAQLAVCWQNLFNDRPSRNGVYIYNNEDAGFFVIEWSDIMLEQVTQDTAQFQIILYDPEKYVTSSGDGEIKFQYRRFAEVQGAVDRHHFATIGIRSPDGNDGIQYRHSFGYNDLAHEISNRFAIKFTTSLENPRGTVRGRFARLEDQQTALAGVRIFSYRGIDVVSAVDGSFEFNVRSGRYDGIRSNLQYFNDMMLSFDVRPDAVTNLGNLLMVHPEISEVPERITTPLQPGFPTLQAVFFRNSGSGPLEYSTTIAHEDGRRATFGILDTFRVGNILADQTSTSPVYVDSVVYLPRSNGGGGAQVMTALNLNNGRVGEEVPFPGRDSLETTPNSVTWDGTHFWGSLKYLDRPNWIVEFDRQGRKYRQFVAPFDRGYESAFITYCDTRNTLFAVKLEVKEIIEIGLDSANLGQVINRWNISFPAEDFSPSGIGWNSWDTDNMPLYIVEKHWVSLNDTTRGQRIIRMNPDSGVIEIWAYIRNVNRPPQADRSSYGISFIPGYRGESVAIVLNESALPRANDVLKIISIGPYIPFVTDGLARAAGTVGAGGLGWFVIPFDATGLAERDYNFGVWIKHNAVGDSILVPITLHVDRFASSPGDPSPLPIDFGITRLYPNPFNSRIGIDFVIPQGIKSLLKVYDVGGREVATLFDGITTGGREQIYWNADGVSTGVYIMRLESGDRVMTRKAALIK